MESTALMVAISSEKCVDIVGILIEAGANVNITGKVSFNYIYHTYMCYSGKCE